ncbi:MAG: hypothetical protein AB8G05_09505 [Oligoflexales bacterium]
MEVESHFFDKLAHALNKWPDNVRWSLHQLASYTTYEAEWVAKCIGTALSKNLVVDDKLSREEVVIAFERLKDVSDKKIKEKQESHQESFAKIKIKIQNYARQKMWQQAYQTCAYYLGNAGPSLSYEELTFLQDECIRLGTKSERSVQELFVILKSQEKATIKNGNSGDLADYLDIVDAYQEYFCKDINGKKQLLVMLDEIFPYCKQHGLENELLELKVGIEKS